LDDDEPANVRLIQKKYLFIVYSIKLVLAELPPFTQRGDGRVTHGSNPKNDNTK
jgi:hypothetical protein